MAQQKKKENHWVSQSYLRGFAADTPERRKIWTLSKKTNGPQLRKIKKVAVSFYLYAPYDLDGLRDYRFEDKLASLENLFNPTFRALFATGFPDLCSDPIRKGLSLLTAVMYLRNPLQLAIVQNIHRTLVDWFSQGDELPDAVEINGRAIELDKSDWPTYRDADKDATKRMWLNNINSAVWLAKIMMEMRWAVLFSEKPVFITTDNPVIVMHPDLQFRGFNNPETTVFFPLSPTRVLVMDNRHYEPDGQYYPLKGSAAGLNLLFWREAIDSMFSPRHPDEVCSEMIEDVEITGFEWLPLVGWVQQDEHVRD